jgi:hypothetical protein
VGGNRAADGPLCIEITLVYYRPLNKVPSAGNVDKMRNSPLSHTLSMPYLGWAEYRSLVVCIQSQYQEISMGGGIFLTLWYGLSQSPSKNGGVQWAL